MAGDGDGRGGAGRGLCCPPEAQAIWRPFIDRQPLTKTGAETVSKLLARTISPTDAWKDFSTL